MINIPSLLRCAELKALSSVTLNGKVLDLGGVKDSSYLHAIKGNFSVTTVNTDKKTNPDIIHNLELILPVGEGTYDHVILINVIEHIFEYRSLLKESFRVLRKNGSAIIIAPFIFPLHPSPGDYHRFSGTALNLELKKAGFEIESLIPLGTGIFSVVYLFIDRLMPKFLRFFNYYIFRYMVYTLDKILHKTASMLGKKYSPEDYAFGFCVVARRK